MKCKHATWSAKRLPSASPKPTTEFAEPRLSERGGTNVGVFVPTWPIITQAPSCKIPVLAGGQGRGSMVHFLNQRLSRCIPLDKANEKGEPEGGQGGGVSQLKLPYRGNRTKGGGGNHSGNLVNRCSGVAPANQSKERAKTKSS